MDWKVQACELAVVLLGCFVVGACRIFWRSVTPDVFMPFVQMNLCNPMSLRSIPIDPFESRCVARRFKSVALILRRSAFAKIVTTVVKPIMVFMVHSFIRLATKDESVHPDVFRDSPPQCVKCFCVTVPIRAPRPLVEPLKISGIHQSILSLRQRDKTVGWVGRLSNGVSWFHAESWHRSSCKGLLRLSRYSIIVLLLFLAPSVFGQTTSVSGTFVDSAGATWKNGTYSFQFTPSPSNPTAQYFQGSVPFDKNTIISGNLDNTGSLTGVAVPDNLTIVPSGSTYAFQICAAATNTNGCFKVPLTITGASQNISSAVVPPAILVNVANPGFYAAYFDTEIVGAKQGVTYFNLTDNTLHLCSGFPVCIWLSLASPASIIGLNNTFTGSNTFNLLTTFGSGITGTGTIGTLGLGPTALGANNAFTGTMSAINFNGVQWAGPGATQTIDQAVTACGANPCTVMISSLYTGPESANLSFTAIDGANYNLYRGSNNITIHDLRASFNKAYGLNYGGTTLGSLARFAVTQAISSPSMTTSAILGTNLISGNVSAGGGGLTAITAEVDIEGAITGGPVNTVQAMTAQWAVRSTGQTLPQVMGIQGGGGIDRAGGAGGTNILLAEGVEGDGAAPNLGTGAISNNFGVRGVQTNVGTVNNFALVSEGDTMFKDNGCLYSENGSSPALKVICFGIDNLSTGGGNIFSTTNSPAAWKYIVNGGHFNWLAGPQVFTNNGFDFIPSTAINGTVFTSPSVFTITSTGVGNNTSGFKHIRFAGNLGGTCPTAGVVGSPCTSGNINWTTAFADNSYTITCSLVGAMTGQPHIVSVSYQAAGAGITITIAADTAVAANVAPTGFVDCIGVHD
jgi:hypothetical protein